MNDLVQILVDILPALIVSSAVIYIFHEYVRYLKDRDARRASHEAALAKQAGSKPAKATEATTAEERSAASETLIKQKLQAAERFALYLERIAPDRLVMRLHQNGMSAKMLQNDMLRTIREEYDHNLSQQVYVSEGLWELIKNAKQEMMGFVSATGDGLKSSATGMELSRNLFETASKVENMPNELALKLLRAEVRDYSE
jgi:hypothetical protein